MLSKSSVNSDAIDIHQNTSFNSLSEWCDLRIPDKTVLQNHRLSDSAVHTRWWQSLNKWYRVVWLKCYFLQALTRKHIGVEQNTWAVLLGELSDFKRTLDDAIEAAETATILLKPAPSEEIHAGNYVAMDNLINLSRRIQALTDVGWLYYNAL